MYTRNVVAVASRIVAAIAIRGKKPSSNRRSKDRITDSAQSTGNVERLTIVVFRSVYCPPASPTYLDGGSTFTSSLLTNHQDTMSPGNITNDWPSPNWAKTSPFLPGSSHHPGLDRPERFGGLNTWSALLT